MLRMCLILLVLKPGCVNWRRNITNCISIGLKEIISTRRQSGIIIVVYLNSKNSVDQTEEANPASKKDQEGNDIYNAIANQVN